MGPVIQRAGVVSFGGIEVPVQRALVSAVAGLNVLVGTPTLSGAVFVLGGNLNLAGTSTFRVQSGGGGILSGTMTFNGVSNLPLDDTLSGHFQSVAGEALILANGSSTLIAGWLYYAVRPA